MSLPASFLTRLTTKNFEWGVDDFFSWISWLCIWTPKQSHHEVIHFGSIAWPNKSINTDCSFIGINMKAILFVSVLTAFVMSSTASFAECRKSHVCDGNGQNCRYQDVCSSKLDLPSVGLNPLTPLPPMDLKPLPSLALPPLGTSRCEYLQVNGRWQNICHWWSRTMAGSNDISPLQNRPDTSDKTFASFRQHRALALLKYPA